MPTPAPAPRPTPTSGPRSRPLASRGGVVGDAPPVGLSIDWAAFFDRRALGDWEDADAPYTALEHWRQRAERDPRMQDALVPVRDFELVWEQLHYHGLRLAPDAEVAVGDSHRHAAEWLRPCRAILHLDEAPDMATGRSHAEWDRLLREWEERGQAQAWSHDWLGVLLELTAPTVEVIMPAWSAWMDPSARDTLLDLRRFWTQRRRPFDAFPYPAGLAAWARAHPAPIARVYIARSGWRTPPWADPAFKEFVYAAGFGRPMRLYELPARPWQRVGGRLSDAQLAGPTAPLPVRHPLRDATGRPAGGVRSGPTPLARGGRSGGR